MSIVGSLFRTVAPALVDNLEAQGLFRSSTRIAPSLVPEMFIGREGITNLGEAGVMDAPAAIKTLEDAQRDWFRLPADEWNETYAKQGIAFDPVANKSMMEISDKNVSLQRGVDLNKIPENEVLTFDEVFKADTLKKAYPDINELTVSFIDDPMSSRLAAFAPEQNMILFNRQHPEWKSSDAPVKTALHEVQHYVQGKELFTQGESFAATLNENQLYKDSSQALSQVISQSVPESLQFAKKYKGIGFDKDTVIDAVAGLAAKDGASARTSLAKAFGSREMADKFIANAQQYPALDAAIKAKNLTTQAYQQSVADYMKVAGEVFARQTEQRRGLSVAERIQDPAMMAIETDPANRAAGITIDNMTAPRAQAAQESMGLSDQRAAAQAWANTPEYRAGLAQQMEQRNMEIIDRVMRESAAKDMPFYKTKKEIESSMGQKMTPQQEEIVREFLKGNRPRFASLEESSIPPLAVPQSTIPGI